MQAATSMSISLYLVGLSKNMQFSLLKIISFWAVVERKVNVHTIDI